MYTYNTPINGLSRSNLVDGYKFETIQKLVVKCISNNKDVGHNLEKDLKSLLICSNKYEALADYYTDKKAAPTLYGTASHKLFLDATPNAYSKRSKYHQF